MLPGPPVKVNGLPLHTGVLLLAVATGEALTTTTVLAVDEQPLPLVTVKL